MKKLFILLFIGTIMGSCSKSDEGVEIPAKVTSVEPGGAMAGETITIYGENFGKSQSAVRVTFAGTKATITYFSSTEIQVIVPNVESGDLGVYLEGEQLYSDHFIVEKDLSVLVNDEFNGSGAVSGRVPSSSIAERPWFSNTEVSAFIDGTRLAVGNAAVVAYDISDDADGWYEKPEEITLNTSFNLGNVATEGHDFRGLFMGFYSETEGITAPTQNFRGLIVDPEGQISFWNADNTAWNNLSGATEQMDYQGDWDAAADHTLELSVNTVTGDWISVIIDGEVYDFGSTDAFAGSKTDNFGFGMWTAVSAAYLGYVNDVVYGAYQQ